MSWQKYVRQHAAGRSQSDLAAAVGVTPGTVSKWISGTQGIDAAKAIAFARGVGDAPLAALIAGGFLTQAEAKSRPAAAPDYSQLSNDQLLDLVRDRMRVGEGNVRAPSMNVAEGTSATGESDSGGDGSPGPRGSEPSPGEGIQAARLPARKSRGTRGATHSAGGKSGRRGQGGRRRPSDPA